MALDAEVDRSVMSIPLATPSSYRRSAPSYNLMFHYEFGRLEEK